MMLPLLASVLLQATTPAAATVARPNPKEMKPAEIRAFNASIDSTHPYYIVCKQVAPKTGSLVSRRQSSCRTNEEWKQAWARGNQEARDAMDEFSSKGGNTSN